MQLIWSETNTNVATSNEVGSKSTPLPNAQPHTSTHSLDNDSNCNRDDENQENGNIFENATMATGVVNLNTAILCNWFLTPTFWIMDETI